MTTTKKVSAAATKVANSNTVISKELKSGSLDAEQVKEMLDNNIMHEEFLSLAPGFNGVFDVEEIDGKEMTNFQKKTKFMMPRYRFTSQTKNFVMNGSTIFNAVLVNETCDLGVKPIDSAGGLPVYFRDEFNSANVNIRTISSYRTAAGLKMYDKYEIIGALVNRSTIDSKRWSIKYKSFEHWASFLEYAQIADPSIYYLTEASIYEISRKSEADRTFKNSKGVMVTLPDTSSLVIRNNADKDPTWANAQFIIRKTW